MKNKEKLFNDALDIWGDNIAIMIAMEEMAELTKALSKYVRGGYDNEADVIEEIADVELMMDQMKVLLGRHVDCNLTEVDSDVQNIAKNKMVRLGSRIRHKLGTSK